MAISVSGQSMPNAPDAKSGKSSSISGVVSSLKRFTSMENIKPHFDLSRRYAPATENRRGQKAGKMAGHRFPVILNNTESRPAPRPLSRPLIVPGESYSQTPSGTIVSPVSPFSRASNTATIVALPKKMDSSASLIELSSHRGSTGTVLTGEGRPTMRRARSTLSLFPSPEDALAPEFPEVAVIQLPPKAKVTETKTQASSVKVIDFADFTPATSVTSLIPDPDVKASVASITPDVPPKVFTNHKNSSTLTLTKSSTVAKITNFITMQPNNPPAAAVELTPLSGLIAQSRRDIQTLKAINAKSQVPPPVNDSAATTTPVPASANGVVGTGKRMLKSTWSSVGNLRKAFQDSSEEFTTPVTEETEMTEPKKEVDYEKMEKNLDRFEDLYEAFLSLTDANGEHNEEIHLLAVVSKKGEMVRGVRQAGGIKLTKKVVASPPTHPAMDCGM